MDYVYLIVGLALILFGASWLTDGASALARRWGVSDLVIGLTIVAFGTSAPELVISIVSALNGNSGIAIGNVVGSNIFNILMITGCTALVMPLGVGRSTLSKEIPLVILSSLVLWFCSADMLIDGASENVVSRADGLVLLAFFLIFMRYTFSIARDKPADAVPKSATVRPMKAGISVLYVVAGLAGLVFGGQGFVKGASGIASSLGVSDAVIGLTIVAAGTSLPELATSIVAAIKKNPGIAIGNVVGSSIFNAFFIMGSRDYFADEGRRHFYNRLCRAYRSIAAALHFRPGLRTAHHQALGRRRDGDMLRAIYRLACSQRCARLMR